MEITKEIFEKYVPALISPDSQLFDKLESFISTALLRLDHIEATDYLTTDTLTAAASSHVCASAAYDALPQLDLVATPTGFGVVSNQNLAPASRERVEALREQLRGQRSTAYDRLIEELLRTTDWRNTDSAQLIVNSLLFLPAHLRRYGVTLDGHTVYHEEFERMQTNIGRAEAQLDFLISRELHEKLIALQLTAEGERTAEERITIEQSRLYLAVILDKSNPHAVERIGRRLLDTIRKAGFEEYLQSSTYAAQIFTPYQNEQKHPTFFFG